jgi:hypothetical protein
MSLEDQVNELQQQVQALVDQVGRLDDANAIRHLQYKYGYYLDKCLYEEVVDLFAEDGEVRFMGGIYKGKAGVRRLYIGRFQKNFTGGVNGPVFGFLLDHPQLQMIVEVAPDRNTARVRGRSMMQAGRHESTTAAESVPRQWWEGGIYENQYVRENGVWKLKVLNYNPFWHADYETGWAHTRPEYVPMASVTYPEDPDGPDELITPTPRLWPHTEVVPFHYSHPVTGKPWQGEDS